MVLAAIDATGYKIVLILHIVAVIVGFGALFVVPMLGRAEGASATGRRRHARLRPAGRGAGVAVAGILGFALIGMSDKVWEFKQRWVGIAILLWIVELAVLWFGVAATEKKVGRRRRRGRPAGPCSPASPTCCCWCSSTSWCSSRASERPPGSAPGAVPDG